MGAWGVKTFENDYAQDWLELLINQSSKKMIIEALYEINTNDEYLEAPECSIALAAIDVIARSNSLKLEDLPEELVLWITKKHGFFRKLIRFNTEEIILAINVLKKITSSSELKELWEESECFEEWLEYQLEIEKLLKRS
jgi:hypothetical protein